MTATTCYTYIDSPLGCLLVCGDGHALTGLYTHGHKRQSDAAWIEDHAPFDAVREQLADYFAGVRPTFDVPLHLAGTHAGAIPQTEQHPVARQVTGGQAELSAATYHNRVCFNRDVSFLGPASAKHLHQAF